MCVSFQQSKSNGVNKVKASNGADGYVFNRAMFLILTFGGNKTKFYHLFSQSLSGHQRSVRSLCFSPSSSMLCSGSVSGEVRVWSVATSTCVGCFQAHHGATEALTFLQEGALLLSAGSDQTVRHLFFFSLSVWIFTLFCWSWTFFYCIWFNLSIVFMIYVKLWSLCCYPSVFMCLHFKHLFIPHTVGKETVQLTLSQGRTNSPVLSKYNITGSEMSSFW